MLICDKKWKLHVIQLLNKIKEDDQRSAIGESSDHHRSR